jgi:HlyD family secretion protein
MTFLSKHRWSVIAAVVILGGAALWYALAGASGARGGYETKPVDNGTIERIVSASGPVNAVVTVVVGTQVSGQIAVLDVDFNARVKKGQRLALIDPQTFQSRVRQAESDLTAARTQRSLQGANVARAEAQLVKERRALDRLQTLLAKGFTSTAQMDAQKAVIASAEADVSVAKAQVENAQANIAAKEAALAQAKIDLSRTEIFSPIDGIVIERNVDRGQTVAASLQAPTLFKIAQDLSQIQIEAQVDEADIGGVKEGQPVTFTVGSYAQREFRGRVGQVRVGGLNQQSVVTYTVIVAAANRGLELLPGMTASVKIQTGRREGVLRLPNEALRFKPPTELQEAQASENGAGQGGRRREELIADLTQSLKLTAEQQLALKVALEERMRRWGQGGNGGRPQNGGGGEGAASAGEGRPGGGGGGQRGRGFDRVIASTLEPMLSPEQKAKLEEWRITRANTRRAPVWVMKGSTPTQMRVTLGIADDRFTEIVGGDLKAGDPVVTRYTEPGA